MKTTVKRNISKFAVGVISLMVAAVLLLTTFSGAINSGSQSAFDELFSTYGDSILDISIIDNFMSAGGTGGNDPDEPNVNVNQDIGGLYEKYFADERTQFALYIQAFDNIEVTVDGKIHSVEKSNNVPVMNKLVEGKMPDEKGSDNKNNVVVSESFVKKLGLSNKEAIGKEIKFSSSVYNWSTGEAVLKNVKTTATITGVANTSVISEYDGEIYEYSIDDSFFFSKSALDDMRLQAALENENANFLIRAKSPADMIAIKDELSKTGIVPLGRFELVEDMVRLNNQTVAQSGSASAVIGVLSLFMVITIFLITSAMKKREYAIYKVSGFNNKHLGLINFTESLAQTVAAEVLMLVTSPLLQIITSFLFKVNILNLKMLITGAILLIACTIIAYTVTSIIYLKLNITAALKTGNK